MNKYLLLLATPLAFQVSALAGPKEDLQAAIQKLKSSPNYTWVSKTEVEGSQFPMNQGAVTGKAEKDGFALITQSTDDQSVQVIQKGEKALLKTDSGWQLASELPEIARGGGGGGGPDPSMRAAMMGRRLLTTKRPTDDLSGYLDKVKEVKSADGSYVGELTPEAAKELATAGRGRGGRGGGAGGGGGGGAPREAKDAKGTVTWWVKDGNISKIQLKVSGKFTNRDGEENLITRTTVTEIKDVGSTKFEVPEAARKKLTI